MHRIDFRSRQALYSVDGTRRIEHFASAALPAHTLMRRAGLAVARLGMAIAPHCRLIWIACGPGNNGGDGLEAAIYLTQLGKSVIVTCLGALDSAPADAAASYRRALAAGVHFSETPPVEFDLCIDALLGVGASRAPEGLMANWIDVINASSAIVLAVDTPTGLQADTGAAEGHVVNAYHTLSLLTLKPGLFTAHGRDSAGTVWLDDLGVPDGMSKDPHDIAPVAWLASAPANAPRLHSSHKGTYGDVAIVGGASGMAGAARLAASAALHCGAGRVLVGMLDQNPVLFDPCQPELMFRQIETLDFRRLTVVAGCGGGEAIREPLAKMLASSARLVVDADAINVIARDTQLQTALRMRANRDLPTVLTPHPLEAARLLDCTAQQVQCNRLKAAEQLSQRFSCTVVLKGSGTIISAPHQTSVINPTGNPRLATAGTGDVLAGMIGAALGVETCWEAVCGAVYKHGLLADHWPLCTPLTASSLYRLQ